MSARKCSAWMEHVREDYHAAVITWERDRDEFAIGYGTERAEFEELNPRPSWRDFMKAAAGPRAVREDVDSVLTDRNPQATVAAVQRGDRTVWQHTCAACGESFTAKRKHTKRTTCYRPVCLDTRGPGA